MYEKVFNSKVLGRAREITKPSLAYQETNFLTAGIPDFGLLKYLLRPIKNWFRKMEWWWLYEQTCDRGVSIEDTTLIKGWELRRDILTEHIFRESLHPMFRELIRLRHLRHQKVEQAVAGFIAPDYIKEETRKRTFLKSAGNFMTWRHFYQQNYENDQTAHSTYLHNSRNILELVYLVGLFDRNAWNRYFFNEKHYYTVDDFIDENRMERKLQLSDPKDFEEFVKRCEAANEKYPGMYAPPGEKIDREELKKQIEEIISQTGWKDLSSDEFSDMGLLAKAEKVPFVQPKFEGEHAVGKSNVGLDFPAFLQKWKGNGFFQ